MIYYHHVPTSSLIVTTINGVMVVARCWYQDYDDRERFWARHSDGDDKGYDFRWMDEDSSSCMRSLCEPLLSFLPSFSSISFFCPLPPRRSPFIPFARKCIESVFYFLLLLLTCYLYVKAKAEGSYSEAFQRVQYHMPTIPWASQDKQYKQNGRALKTFIFIIARSIII